VIEDSDLEIFARSLRQATSSHTAAALDAALFELGWLDALESDASAAIAMLFPLQGAANSTSFALDQVVMAGLDTGAEPGSAVVLPGLGTWAAPGAVAGDAVSVRGLGTSALRRCQTVQVVARTTDPAVDALVAVDLSALSLRPVAGLDPGFGLVEVSGDSVRASKITPMPAAKWDGAVARARLAVGYELVGAARTMLEQAREHALNRLQFGQPISRFQAVRHRLAETLVAIEAADAVLAAAGESYDPQLSAAAKALSGRGARTAARHCQQVLAGIGFTAEHPFHRYLKRVLLLDQLLGDSRSLTEALGKELLTSRRMPSLLPL
jgi:alkylation response protein AidB-like acyl-CoA dehydrogenase